MDQVMNLGFVQVWMNAPDIILLAVTGAVLVLLSRVVIWSHEELQMMMRWRLEDCIEEQAADCKEPFVDSWRWLKLVLIILWTALGAVSMPRLLLTCLNLLGYSRTSGLSRVARFLRNWATRHQHRRCLWLFGRLESYAKYGWNIRIGVTLMGVGAVAGLFVGLKITGMA